MIAGLVSSGLLSGKNHFDKRHLDSRGFSYIFHGITGCVTRTCLLGGGQSSGCLGSQVVVREAVLVEEHG